MSSTSCYEMAPIFTQTPINLLKIASMVAIASSIYGPSSVTFINDTNAYDTVDID
jgi:hypothetical protein